MINIQLISKILVSVVAVAASKDLPPRMEGWGGWSIPNIPGNNRFFSSSFSPLTDDRLVINSRFDNINFVDGRSILIMSSLNL